MDEKQLIDLLKSKDQEAFNQLFGMYQQKIFHLCCKMLRDEEDASDATQTIFMKVFQSIDKFKKQSRLSTWIYRIAVNTCNDLLRKRKSKKEAPISTITNEEEETNVDIPDDTNNPEEKLLKQEQAQTIKKALDSMKPKQRELIILRDINGFSYEEIADILKMNVGTVKSGINRARKALLELLVHHKF